MGQEGWEIKVLFKSPNHSRSTSGKPHCSSTPLPSWPVLVGVKYTAQILHYSDTASFKQECLRISSSGSDWFDEDHRLLAKGLHLHLPNFCCIKLKGGFYAVVTKTLIYREALEWPVCRAGLPGNFKGLKNIWNRKLGICATEVPLCSLELP